VSVLHDGVPDVQYDDGEAGSLEEVQGQPEQGKPAHIGFHGVSYHIALFTCSLPKNTLL